MALGSVLSALGQAFTGYAQDDQAREQRSLRQQQLQRQLGQDAMSAQLHGAQMENYKAEALMRNQRSQQEAFMRSPEFEQRYRSAMDGDRDSEAWVRSKVSGHPNEAPILAPFNRAPVQPHYDATRGVFVKPDGTFTPVKGLPQAQAKPSDARAQEAADRADRSQRRTELQGAVTTSKGALDESIKMLPRPSKLPGGGMAMNPAFLNAKQGQKVTGPHMVPSEERTQMVADSTERHHRLVDPAQATYNSAVDEFQKFTRGGGGSAAPEPTKAKISQAAYDRARAHYTDAEIEAKYDLSGVRRK